jgi:hypothetical protein
MIPSHAGEQAAIAGQLLEALQTYERDLQSLVSRGLDPELSLKVGQDFDRMRMYAGSLPTLSTVWVELLISRFELLHAMWSNRLPVPSHRIGKLHEQHRAAIEDVRRKCAAYLPGEA